MYLLFISYTILSLVKVPMKSMPNFVCMSLCAYVSRQVNELAWGVPPPPQTFPLTQRLAMELVSMYTHHLFGIQQTNNNEIMATYFIVGRHSILSLTTVPQEP